MSDMRQVTVWDIAKLCHQANKAWCEVNGDYSQPDWDKAPDWQRESAVSGVAFVLANPTAGDEANHVNWTRDKIKDGWGYGAVKDPVAKTHPCLVPFSELPWHQQMKDRLFRAIALQFVGAGIAQ